MSRTLQALVLICTAGLLAAGAWADDKKATLDDSTFVKKAAIGNAYEVKLGEIAAKEATHTEVREFGQKMVKDHTRALDALKKAARAAKIDVPDELDKHHQQQVDRFARFDGKDFDSAYVRSMIYDHEEDAALFEKATKELKNSDLRKYAESTLPVVREHLKRIRKIGDTLGVKVETRKQNSDKDGVKGDKDKPAKEKPFKDR